jgi:hypothetical protein
MVKTFGREREVINIGIPEHDICKTPRTDQTLSSASVSDASEQLRQVKRASGL